MKPIAKKRQYDLVIWMLIIAAVCLIALAAYFIWCVLSEPPVNGTLVMADKIFGKWDLL